MQCICNVYNHNGICREIFDGHLPPCIASWFHDRIGLLDKSPYRFERCLRLRLRNSESRPCQHFTDRKLGASFHQSLVHLSIQSVHHFCSHSLVPYNRKCLRIEICGPCHACLSLNFSDIKWQWRACLWRWVHLARYLPDLVPAWPLFSLWQPA